MPECRAPRESRTFAYKLHTDNVVICIFSLLDPGFLKIILKTACFSRWCRFVHFREFTSFFFVPSSDINSVEMRKWAIFHWPARGAYPHSLYSLCSLVRSDRREITRNWEISHECLSNHSVDSIFPLPVSTGDPLDGLACTVCWICYITSSLQHHFFSSCILHARNAKKSTIHLNYEAQIVSDSLSPSKWAWRL